MSVGNRTWRIDYFPLGSTTGTQLQNVLDIRITRTGSATDNKAEVILTSVQGAGIAEGAVIYKADEAFKIYAAQGDIDITNVAHLMGTYTILDSSIDIQARTITIMLMDRTYDVLSKIYVGDLNDTVPNIIANVYQTVSNDRSALTNIATVKSDASSFASIEYYVFNKTAYEVLNDLSQPNFTGDDRTYIFWVDETDTLNWVYPGQTPESQAFAAGSDPLIATKIAKSESNVVSMIIYNAGPDKDGNDYVDFYLAPNADAIKGRMRYEEMRYLSKDLAVTSFWTSSTNAQVQTELKIRAEDNGRRIVNQIGTGLWQASLTVEGGQYDFGGLYNVEAPDFGFPTTLLRLDRITHTMNKNGWSTTLTLKQDAESLN